MRVKSCLLAAVMLCCVAAVSFAGSADSVNLWNLDESSDMVVVQNFMSKVKYADFVSNEDGSVVYKDFNYNGYAFDKVSFNFKDGKLSGAFLYFKNKAQASQFMEELKKSYKYNSANCVFRDEEDGLIRMRMMGNQVCLEYRF